MPVPASEFILFYLFFFPHRLRDVFFDQHALNSMLAVSSCLHQLWLLAQWRLLCLLGIMRSKHICESEVISH
jgi:hypothetical protein